MSIRLQRTMRGDEIWYVSDGEREVWIGARDDGPGYRAAYYVGRRQMTGRVSDTLDEAIDDADGWVHHRST